MGNGVKIYENAFAGYIDILGYGEFQSALNSFNIETRKALIDTVFNGLDQLVEQTWKDTDISFYRYGDGYIFFSEDNETEDSQKNNLVEIIKRSCRILALSLARTTPMRISITQETIHVDKPDTGLSITGKAWDILLKMEKSLDWMGGFLNLSNWGRYQKTVESLVRTAYLVKKQTNMQDQTLKFNPPFKDNHSFISNNVWFLNWHRIMHHDKKTVESQIKNWWTQPHGIVTNLSEEEKSKVEDKQNNTICFADYCIALREASELLYHSDIVENKRELEKVFSDSH